MGGYTTWRRFGRKGTGGMGRLAYARPVDDRCEGVGLLPEVALRIRLEGPLVVQERSVVLVPVAANRFEARLDGPGGEVVATGGVVSVLAAIGRRLPAGFSVFEE